MNSLCENAVSGDYSAEGLIPKKVHFRDKDESVNMDLLADHVGQPTASWKENLVGSSSNIGGEDLEVKEDFEVLEGDIQKSIINGIQCILIQDMKKNYDFEAPGYNIGFSILQNRIYSLWKPSLTVHLMDIENGFFLAKFVNKIDYEKIFGVARLHVQTQDISGNRGIGGQGHKVVVSMTVEETSENGGSYGPWMHVEERSRALSEMEKIVGMDARDKYEYPYNCKNKGREILPGVNLGIEISHCNVSRLDNRAQNRGPLNELGFKNLGLGESSLALGIKLGQQNGSPNGLVVSMDPLLQDWGVEEFGKKS
ncbi:hypothetical protein Golax_002063, partial [Gossypium laxum]|nr:hypothetical protein [Gossypium laxum]